MNATRKTHRILPVFLIAGSLCLLWPAFVTSALAQQKEKETAPPSPAPAGAPHQPGITMPGSGPEAPPHELGAEPPPPAPWVGSGQHLQPGPQGRPGMQGPPPGAPPQPGMAPGGPRPPMPGQPGMGPMPGGPGRGAGGSEGQGMMGGMGHGGPGMGQPGGAGMGPEMPAAPGGMGPYGPGGPMGGMGSYGPGGPMGGMGSYGSMSPGAFPGGKPSEKEIEDILKAEFPDMLEAYKGLKEKHTPEAGRQRAEIEQFAGQMRMLRQMNPDEFKREKEIHRLEFRSQDMSRRIREAGKGPEKEKLVKELSGIVGQLFELREKQRAEEAARIEQELKKIRSLLEERKKNRDLIIERRVRQLMGEEDTLNW